MKFCKVVVHDLTNDISYDAVMLKIAGQPVLTGINSFGPA